MQAAQNSFISSTFWTERIKPSAALKTLEVMEEKNLGIKYQKIGKGIKLKWNDLALKHDVGIKYQVFLLIFKLLIQEPFSI